MNVALKDWLDRAVDGCESKYSPDEHSLPVPKNGLPTDMRNIYRYYIADDLRSSDKFFINCLNNTDREQLNEDKQLKFLNCVTDRFIDRSNGNIKSVLIPPNTNRYHSNFLFKKLVDRCDDKKMTYQVADESFKLVDPNLKEAFYQFCFENTHKDNLTV